MHRFVVDSLGSEYPKTISSTTYVAPEVTTNGVVTSDRSHTGKNSTKVLSGQFAYKTVLKSGEHRAGRYLLSVWAHLDEYRNARVNINGTLEGLLRLKARGVVKNVGYGMRPHNFHMKAIATGDVDLILCFSDYNLIRQTAAEELLPAAKSAGIGVMNGFSILRGLLTGVNIKEAQKLGNYKVDVDADQAQIFWDWCYKNGVNLLQLALQFCLANDSIHAHPIGSLNREQLDTNVRAAKTPLDKAVIDKFTQHFNISWG